MRKIMLLIGLLWWPKLVMAGWATSPEWLSIVHYQPTMMEGVVSSIDSPNFFLSSGGKSDPEAELEATIALFQSNDVQKQCLFPARYRLLKKQGLVSAPYPSCAEQEKFYADLQPAGITLLFTDAYMSNPSSLFGHTLLRIDTQRQGTQLLAHGVNYGAFTSEKENPALFAILGIFGGYYGGFTVKPYYDIINTYNNIENRDIWEFQLDFSPEERDLLVAHLWEVGHAQSRYYFFTRNCSYMLMEMLDAVRPSLQLAQKFPVQTIPLDTLKAVYEMPGLVKEVKYRPSRQGKIVHRFQNMTPQQKQDYLQIIKGEKIDLAELDEAEQADVLETAYQYVQYQYVAGKLELPEYRRQSFQALVARNKLKSSGKIAEKSEGRSPLQTHESKRLTMGAGVRNGQGFQEIGMRPAYHSLTDDNFGYLRGAEINFLNATLRRYDQDNNYVLQKLDLLGIRSLAPRSEMFQPLSFQIGADISREMNPDTQKEGYVFNFIIGAGETHAITDNLYVYGMGNLRAAYGGFLPHDQYLGVGAAVGVYGDWDDFRLLAETEKIFATTNFGDKIRYKAELTYTIDRHNAVALNYLYEDNHGKNLNENMLSWRTYF